MFYNPFDKVANELFKMRSEIDEEYYGQMRNSSIVCRKCKTSLQSFLDSGFVGCAHCYDTFKQYAKELALDVHGRIGHIGKVPKIELTKASKIRELERLIKEKEIAAKKEDYDLAKELKAKIDRLREELKW